MPTSSGPITLPALLADHAARTPEEPWLFHRVGWDWHWLSWNQVAFQVARGAAGLRQSGVPSRAAFGEGFTPAAVAAALAIQAAGAVPVADRESVVAVPAAPSRLDRWTPDLDTLRTSGAGDDLVFAQRTRRDLERAVEAWDSTLPRSGKRPIVLASASAGSSTWEMLLAWTLRTGAAWVLEDDSDAFVSAVLRNRPTLIVAPGAELGLIALSLREKAHRRWHRLRAVGLVDDAPDEIVHREQWDALGVTVVRLASEVQDTPAESAS